MGQLLIPPLHRNRSETTSSIHISSGPAQRESLGEILREGTGKREVISQRCLRVPGYGAQQPKKNGLGFRALMTA